MNDREERLVEILEEADRIDRMLALSVRGVATIAVLLAGLYLFELWAYQP